MFDRLWELLAQCWDLIVPFEVIDHYERGVVLRLGKPHRDLEPGFHWVFPFVEHVVSDIVKPTTQAFLSQTLTTKDGKTVVVSAIVTRSISDVRASLLECESVDSVVRDSTLGVVARQVRQHTWEELHTEDFNSKMLKEIRLRASEFGIKIHRVQLGDIAFTRALSLFKVQ